MNALILTLALRLGRKKTEPERVLLGALAGAMIAQAAGKLPRGQTVLLWLPASMIMMRLAAGKGSLQQMITGAALLMCAAGLVGGMVRALWGATGCLPAAYLLGGLAAAGSGICAMRIRRDMAENASVRLLLLCRGEHAALDAMIDSGNTLQDYLTHLPVIVLPERMAANALHLEALPLRPIFAQTAGGRQKMYVFAPEHVELELDGVCHAVRAVIALSPKMSENVPALVPASLIRGDWNSDRGG